MIISRWWHRKGFGIQSPWAFELVTKVLCDRGNLKARLEKHLDGVEWILLDDIRKKDKSQWKKILADPNATAIFDMRKQGLVVYDPKRIKMIYKI